MDQGHFTEKVVASTCNINFTIGVMCAVLAGKVVCVEQFGVFTTTSSKYLYCQLGEWKFLLSGTGVTPTPVDPVSVSAILGSNTSLIIPFRNPTDEQVLVDVILTGEYFASSISLME